MKSQSDLKIINYHGFQMLQSGSRGVAPSFLSTLTHRINRKMATNVVFTGEPGIGKSYMATDVARMLEGKYRTSTGEIFDIVWDDIDFFGKTLRITPEKGSKARVFKMSEKLIVMLHNLPRTEKNLIWNFNNWFFNRVEQLYDEELNEFAKIDEQIRKLEGGSIPT